MIFFLFLQIITFSNQVHELKYKQILGSNLGPLAIKKIENIKKTLKVQTGQGIRCRNQFSMSAIGLDRSID